ncbi:MAG: TIGR04283 family arsenosugar biosynthesis glycosyltransferase [Thermoanaerobaculia bacterium]
MPFRLSVIIPALNGEQEVRAAVRSAFEAGAAEVIVADGGSGDETVAAAREAGATVVEGERTRGRQLNAGAAIATGDALAFLHVDTRLPPEAGSTIEKAIREGIGFGGFRLRFREEALALRVAERLINFRSRITRCPWGDQAQWIEASLYRSSGGYRPDPLMEDYEMAVRMKRKTRTSILAPTVETSGSRFLATGVLKTVAINWWIVFRWKLGASPETLAALYRRKRS